LLDPESIKAKVNNISKSGTDRRNDGKSISDLFSDLISSFRFLVGFSEYKLFLCFSNLVDVAEE